MGILNDLINSRAASIIKFNDETNYEYLSKLTEESIQVLKDKKDELFSTAITGDKNARNDFNEETIVVLENRPILPIQSNDWVIRDSDSISLYIEKILDNNSAKLNKCISSVGRIELLNDVRRSWVGSGWLISDSMIVTNAHVVDTFAVKQNSKWKFRNGIDGKSVKAKIDFIEEYGALKSSEFEILEILYYEKDYSVDLAFLEIQVPEDNPTNISPIELSDEEYKNGDFVVSIGFPSRHSEIPEELIDDVNKMVGQVYNKKCLSPGQILEQSNHEVVLHDCSTIGGYSGAVLIDILTGKAIGVHFGGRYLEENLAVSWKIIKDRLDRMSKGDVGTTEIQTKVLNEQNLTNYSKESFLINDISSSLPIKINVEVTIDENQLKTSYNIPASNEDRIKQVLEKVRENYKGDPNITNIQLGYKFRNGWITKEKCIVFSVKNKVIQEEAMKNGIQFIPEMIDGVTTDVTFTSIENIIEEKYDYLIEAYNRRRGYYTPPKNTKLKIIEEEMEAIIGVSPDSGWSLLEDFINRIDNKLSLAMYLLSAPHIIDALSKRLKSQKAKLNLILDDYQTWKKEGVKNKDLFNEEVLEILEKTLDMPINFSWASSGLYEKWGLNQIFPYSYHIKLAVRDDEEIWLSSGSWQSTNQPNVDPLSDNNNPKFQNDYNRESNVVIKNKNLSKVLNSFILHDIEEAKKYHGDKKDIVREYVAIPKKSFITERVRSKKMVKYFPPLALKRKIKLKPLLTPDNFGDSVLPLIQNAKKEILFQNQTFNIRQSYNGHIVNLAQALLEKQKDGIDVKIILRGDYSPREMITQLIDLGFSPDWIKVQSGCHNKSLIIDSEIVIVGSHNWTMAGVSDNRDASIIFYDNEIATYYKKIYDYDWLNQAVRYIADTGEGVISFKEESNILSDNIDDYWVVPLSEFM